MSNFILNIAISMQVANSIVLIVSIVKRRKNRKNERRFLDSLALVDKINNKVLNRDTWDKLYYSNEKCARRFLFINRLIAKKIIPIKHHKVMIMQNALVQEDLLNFIGFESEDAETVQNIIKPYVDGEMEVIVLEMIFFVSLIVQIVLMVILL